MINFDKRKSLILQDFNKLLNCYELIIIFPPEILAERLGYFVLNYIKNIDYLLSEKNKVSEQDLYFPIEYLIYLEIICNLCINNDYDLDKILKNIHLYIDLEYQNIENETYTKTFMAKITYEKAKYKGFGKYIFNIKIED